YFFVLAPGVSYSREIVRKLDERRQRFAAMFDNAFDAMAIYEPSGAIVRGNRAAIALLGGAAHFGGSHFSRHIAPSERAKTAAAFERALGGTATALQTSFIDAQDRIIPVTASLTPIIVNGEVVGVVGSARDMTAQRQSEETLLLSRERFRALFDRHPSAVMAISAEGKIEQVNGAMEKLSGFPNEALVGRVPTDLLPAEEVASAQRRFEAVQQGEATSYESIILDKRGRRVEIELDAIPTIVHGHIDGFFAIIKDVSKERTLEARERLQRQRLGSVAQLAAAHAQDVANQIDQTLAFAVESLDVDTVNVALTFENEFRMIHGAAASYETGRSFPIGNTYARHIYGTKDLLVIEDTDTPAWRNDPARAWQPWRQVVASTLFIGGKAAGIIVFLAAEPRQSSFDEADRDFVRVVAALVGASLELERREKQLAGMAFVERLGVALAQSRRVGGCIAVHYVDLGAFKAVNDRFGHAAGDRVLAASAERLRSVLQESDMLARMGGDEFIILQSSCEDEDPHHFAQRLIEAVSHPIEVGAETISLAASVGVARTLLGSEDASDLVRFAEQAMYRAKHSGKNQVVVHDQSSDPSI
ncbi:MAG: sensor domain-containing protein, partial [Vulcanimicrobiaceae bacterium]